ncbi:MAG: recombinase family protein [Candidatus Andersenbacteria bacterium]
MLQLKPQNNYAYCRKSSEDVSRQVQSIPDQINEISLLAQRHETHIPNQNILTEEMSAKKPGRIQFDRLISTIENNEHTNLFCWHFNRLSRNPVDTARLEWLRQQGKLTIITPSQIFDKETNAIVSAVQGAEGNQFLIDLSHNVKRGLKSKRDKGIPSGVASAGYINAGTEKGNKWIEPDQKRFKAVQRALQRILQGIDPMESLRILNDDGFLTIKRKKLGGAPLSKSCWYEMLRNPIYCGHFLSRKEDDKWYQIKDNRYKPMISEAQYWQIQEVLGKRGRTRPSTSSEDSYLGFFTCGECDLAITRDDKSQVRCLCKYKYSDKHRDTCPKCGVHKSEVPTKRKHTHHYMVCAGKKKFKIGASKCPQRASVRETIELQIIAKLKRITIPQEFIDWGLETLEGQSDENIKTEEEILASLEASLIESQKRLDRLNELYKKGVYEYTGGEQKFEEERQKELATLNSNREKITTRQHNGSANKEVDTIYNFAKNALGWFKTGKFRTRKQILYSMSSKGVIMNQTLSLSLDSVFVEIEKTLNDIRKLLPSFEPANFAEFCRVEANQATISTIKLTWLPG